MKDGVNSANRYYLNRFRDAYRQAVIGMEKQADVICVSVHMLSQNRSLIDSSESSASLCRPNDGPACDGGPVLNLQ